MKEKSVNKNIFKNCFRVLGMMWQFDKKTVATVYFFAVMLVVVDLGLSYATTLFLNAITENAITSILDFKILLPLGMFIFFPMVYSSVGWWQFYHHQKLSMFFQQHLTDTLFINTKNSTDIQTLESSKFASLIERVNSNSGKIFMIWDDILNAFANLTRLTAAAVIFLIYKWWFVLILLVVLLPELYLEIRFGKNKWGIWNLDAESRKKYWDAKRYFDSVSSILEIKIYKIGNFFRSKIDEIISKFNKEVVSLEKQRVRQRDFTRILLLGTCGILIMFMMQDVIAGTLLVGTFVFYVQRLSDFRNGLMSTFREAGKIASDNPFVNDIFEFLDTKKVIKNGKEKLNEGTPKVEYRGVSFKYPGSDKYILENISLTIEPGEKVAIVGVNGAGKTTFTKTLMRFYDVTSGEILIDGKNIKEIDINTFYEKLGYLPQDYARYRLTIAEAISISDPYRKSASKESKLEEIIEASKKAGSHEFIMGLEKGYDTQLGKEFEGGVEPSVGQWQKLALARLFYKNPQVWILDEPTASIDAVAEIQIFNELEKLSKDKTVILISHRFNTVKNADKIIVIEHGKIAEMGSHDELMNISEGHYKNLFNSQKDSYN